MKTLMTTIFFFFFFLLVSLFYQSVSVDTLAPNQSLLDNNETLVSSGQSFVLGFFSPLGSENRYVGIWFKNVAQQTVIWVANNNNPISNSSGVLRVTARGEITISLVNQTEIIWSSNSSSAAASNPVLQLLENGNLVVREGDSENYLWQSFDFPRDTLVPGMKLGWNLRTRKEWFITSWKSLQDPSTGDSSYTYRLDIRGLPTLILRQGSNIQYRSGPWDGLHFGRYAISTPNSQVVVPIMVYDDENLYYTYTNGEKAVISRFVVNQTGMIKLYLWSQDQIRWTDIATIQSDTCDTYKYCGSNSLCNINGQPLCQCLDGFEPRNPQEWERFQWSEGCRRKVPLNCSEPHGFMTVSGMKLPEGSQVLGEKTMSVADCRTYCLRNCSCIAYASTAANGCVVWYGDLLDMRTYYDDGQELYVRRLASDLVGEF
nr:G-type lectin S-receptor-like serine/threonine-protein kinase At4g27290 isoform X2 [Ipomoea batatas]